MYTYVIVESVTVFERIIDMAVQISWLIEQHILKMEVEGLLRGYTSNQLTRDTIDYIQECDSHRKMQVIIDVSKMQAEPINAEQLYNALTPLMFERQVRWIVLYGANDELSDIFKDIMSDLFHNPCVLVDDYATALSFLYRKDKSLIGVVEVAS